METKINSYIIPDYTKKKMIDAIGRSIKSKTEHGFNLCLDKNKYIRPGKLCIGKRCSIESSEFECKVGQKVIGTFHTHKTSPDPSIKDLSIGYLSGIACIGNYQGIKCYKRKKEDVDNLEYIHLKLNEDIDQFIKLQNDKWLAKKITKKKFKQDIEIYREKVNILVNSYFNIIDIDK